MKTRSQWNAARVELMELAADLDKRMTGCLALHLGRSLEHVLVLGEQVIPRISVQERVKLLEEALVRTEMLEEFGFLVPTLRLVFRDRNTLAHSTTLDLRQSVALMLTLRKGRPTTVEVAADDLRMSIRRAHGCVLDLIVLEPRLGDLMVWGELQGFDEDVEAFHGLPIR